MHAGYQRRLVRVATRSHNTNSDPDGSPPSKLYTLDEEIESWKGFPWALRKEDVEVWDRMIRERGSTNMQSRNRGDGSPPSLSSSPCSSCSTKLYGRSKERLRMPSEPVGHIVQDCLRAKLLS